MSVLTIIAGPNGGGKTWYSNFLVQKEYKYKALKLALIRVKYL